MNHISIASILPLIFAIILLVVALNPERFIRPSRQHMFTNFRWLWISVALILLLGNLVRVIIESGLIE